MSTRRLATLAVAFSIIALAPAVAAAQNGPGSNAGWTAWLGCWELLQDDTRTASTPVSGGTSGGPIRRPAGRPGSDMRVCVLPDGSDAGVTMTTWAAGAVVLFPSFAYLLHLFKGRPPRPRRRPTE